MQSEPDDQQVRFGPYEFDPANCELRKHGLRLKIAGQPLQILSLLTKCPGVVVTREELHQRLWPAGTFVDFENGLNTSVKRLRQALNDDPENPRYVETVPRRGYRFVAEIAGERGDRKPDLSESTGDATTYASPPDTTKSAPLWFWTGLCALAVLLAGIGLLRFRPKPAQSVARVMLAVLPFQNLSGDSQQEYLNDGLTEETITDLGQLSPEKLGVIARTSAMAYKQTSKTIGQVGKELGVDYVLEGSVRRDGGKVRVSAQLIRVKDQTHLWAHNYDRDLHDLLFFQTELGEAIAEQVQVQLSPLRKRELAGNKTVAPDAYEDYLKGRHFWYQFRPDSLNESIGYYQRALKEDSYYAPAWAGLAAAYATMANLYGKPAEDYPKARAAAQRALDLDDSLPEAHESMAAVHIFYDWDWAATDRELTRTEQLNPASAESSLRAYWFEIRGDTDAAIAVLKRALRRDPFNPLLIADLGNAYYYARRPDDAITQYRRMHEVDPMFPLGNSMLGMAYEEKGDLAAAAAEYKRRGDFLSLVVLQARQGHPSGARKLLAQLKNAKKAPDPASLARLCLALGDKNEAVDWLTRARDDRAHWLIWLKLRPEYEGLRSDARFQELVRRIGLP